MQLPPISFIVLDTETTGFIPRVNRVIEFASVSVEDGKIADTYEQLISIDSDIPEPVQVLTRIRPDALEGQPTFDEARDEILKRLGKDTMIVGQNVSFDIRMLKGEGIDLSDRPWIDTSMIASLVFPELASYSLGYVSSVLGLKHEPVHRALGDVNATLELLSRCWERLLELSTEDQEVLRAVMERSAPGYKMLFGALPARPNGLAGREAKNKKRPSWLAMPPPKHVEFEKPPKNLAADILALPEKGEVRLVEEPIDPSTLQSLLDHAVTDPKVTHWIGVKNLHAVLRRVDVPKGVRVIQPPFSLLDKKSAQALSSESELSDDEGTLVTKLQWYNPTVEADIPLHGYEKEIWKGKLACTDTSEGYTSQFKDLPTVILLDHWQLLNILGNPEHAGHAALTKDARPGGQAHIVVDDASMLEDTASRAYGWYCVLDTVRAAATGDPTLTKFTDLLQIWIEKVREYQDLKYLRETDLDSREAKGLREQLADILLSEGAIPDPLVRPLTELQNMLNPNNLKDRIFFVEQRQDGAQYLTSVPERVSELLKEYLYDRFPVTLLIPPGSAGTMREIIPPGAKKDTADTIPFISTLELSFPEDITIETLMKDPPEGKSVILVSSRGQIEDLFVQYTEELEKKGVTLICQNLSGGQGRMQAEFIAADDSTVWIVTPWTFEIIELPPHSIDHLYINSLPFDHPNHAVISKRSEHYRNAFMEYSLRRLEHRLFRLLRTFCRYRTPAGDAQILDQRVKTKRYGAEVLEFLDQFTPEVVGREEASGQQTLF